MELIIAYNDDSFLEELKENLPDFVTLTAYSENKRLERKKAFALKGSWSARKIPFALFKDDDLDVKVFYSEDNSCSVENIITYVRGYIK